MAFAGENQTNDEKDDKINWNVATRTLGGKQFWTDEFIHGGWRIQKNVLTKHYRLLDAKNTRRGWGSWENCRDVWSKLKEQEDVPPLKEKVVIVLHGLGRTRGAMEGISKYLADKGDYSALTVSYASTRATIGDHAQALARIIENLEGVAEINFVAHSMGNLVIRHYLGDQLAAEAGSGVDSRVHRIVMIAPPNNGANLAERFKKNPLFRLVFGKSGQQLGKNWETTRKRLATPPCQFGIIAGGADDGSGRNPLLEGNDDLVVSVDETRLVGATDFIVVPAIHTIMMDDAQVREYTLRFLQHGHFVSEDERQPILATATEPDERP
jgi:pimeloyl-ACP methyl ester carboxylesterase